MTAEDPATAWNRRYLDSNTPWDLGRAHPELERVLNVDPTLGLGHMGTVVVPGCGRGWDAGPLVAAGWKVVGVDLSQDAIDVARRTHPTARFEVADALDPGALQAAIGGPADALVDHTFFCALPLSLRPRFGIAADAVLAETSTVVSIVFPIGKEPPDQGPPFAMTADELGAVLPSRFERDASEPVGRITGRGWAHQLVRWRSEPQRLG